jgi:hypothetical protein
MTPEERIKLLEERVEALARENHRFRKAQTDQHKFKKMMPSDTWYTAYLQDAIRQLEEQNAEQQKVIENYQKHYNKYGTFYTRYETERLGDSSNLGDTNNIHRDNSRYPQAEETKKEDVI